MTDIQIDSIADLPYGTRIRQSRHLIRSDNALGGSFIGQIITDLAVPIRDLIGNVFLGGMSFDFGDPNAIGPFETNMLLKNLPEVPITDEGPRDGGRGKKSAGLRP